MGVRDRLRSPLNASRVHLDEFIRAAGDATPAGGLVLDAGAGDSRYRHHFAHAHYESADFMKIDKRYAPDITYVSDLSSVPVEDRRFDLVLMTQVLEHLIEPTTVLREMHRVLKPGGQIWASCPFYYEEHEQPYDFYRYTQFSLRHMFAEAGFQEPQIDWLEGYMATLGYQVRLAIAVLPSRPLRAVAMLASDALQRSDIKRKRIGVGHPKNYTVVATA